MFLLRLMNLFSTPEKKAFKLLQVHRSVIAEAGGSYKLLMNYLKKNYEKNAVSSSLNSLGLDFEKDPGKQILNLATLDLLYEARSEHLQSIVLLNLMNGVPNNSDQATNNMIKAAKGKEYQEKEPYKLAKLMSGIIARMVSYEEALSGNDQSWAADAEFEEGALLFDHAVAQASAEISRNLTEMFDKDFKELGNIYINAVQKIDSENIQYWQEKATESERKAQKSFEDWELVELNTLKNLVKG